MFDSAKLFLLGVAGLITIIIVLLAALVRLRDELVNLQIVRENGWMGRASVRSQRKQVQRVLSEIGFRNDHLIEIRGGLDSVAGRLRYGSRPEHLRPDCELIAALKTWTKPLESGYRNPGNLSYYVDTMGAMDYSEDESLLARITHQWILHLVGRNLIPPPDCFVVGKEGNIVLVRQVCKVMSSSGQIKPIVCKGDKDHSRVTRTTDRSHWTDFEGLAPFLDANQDIASRDRQFTAIALDDNCTTGTMQCSSIRRFNEFVYASGLPFRPIEHAVTLFAVRPDNDTEGNRTRAAFEQVSVRLHALLGLGESEMRQITESEGTKLIASVNSFKVGYGCDSSSTFC